MLFRVLLAGAAGLLGYWLLGAFRFLRRPGLPHTLRWILAVLFACWTGGYLRLLP